MNKFVGVKFRPYGPVYYFDPKEFYLKVGDKVVVETAEGPGCGEVVIIKDKLPGELQEEDLKPVMRLATEEDLEQVKNNRILAKEAYKFCKERIEARELPMKMVDVEVYFDRSKIIFYFTAPTRVDFRELVKDLVKVYRTRIELRQIGVRHETQMLGGLGNCGQICCCRRFLRKFEPVTIKMAKDQNLFLNPSKISGVCGRLLCCLTFEEDHYLEFQKKLPSIGKRYQTSQGICRVTRANIFRRTITFLNEEGQEEEIPLSAWEEIVKNKIEELEQ
ncbi:MAG: regulatory iron-sulfur-containing complex subunit RicT [Desulfonauticus sp.]|nr:regulatory iron-sulfur-containing complex subunit RicT [Desulfonauticus sp.]